MRVVMITGDHPATAMAIARQAGIARAKHRDDGARTGRPERPGTGSRTGRYRCLLPRSA
ncbi:hypothetical protein LP419_13735 [Massilia sp. H-1]|nr:hypothetical protein LP419_13735 [Massilia sp. H-1]